MLLFATLFLGCESTTERIGGYEVHGIDISHHQKAIDWPRIEQAELDFVFVKATEGATHIDSNFIKHWRYLENSKLKRGAYHFFRPKVAVEDQIENFLNLVDYRPGDLPPVLDVEVTDKVPMDKIILGIKEWLTTVESKLHVKPILYTNQKFYNKHLLKSFTNYPLWIARYNNKPPELKNNATWTFWQYGNRGQLEGITTDIDFNVFAGTLEELNQFGFQVP